MANKVIDNIKLGIFVITGLLFLVLALYMVGKNRNLFGRNFELRTHFANVQGLKPGNNVRYAGIEVGTVKGLNIINDSTIEVTFMLKRDLLGLIKQGAEVSIGTDGLVGNRVLNIQPGHDQGPAVTEGGFLPSRLAVSTEEMLEVLSGTNRDMALIAEELKRTIQRINTNTVLWNFLEDPAIGLNIKSSLSKIKLASSEANDLVVSIHSLVQDVRQGQGPIGFLLTDTSLRTEIPITLQEIKQAGRQADATLESIQETVEDLEHALMTGGGPAQALLQDSVLVQKVHAALEQVEQGAAKFGENMEALKHNVLLRRYFKKQEKLKHNP